MKQTIKRLSCLMLALCLVLTALPFSARAEEEKQGVDFVLVMDCSGSMAKNDKEGLAAVACKQLLDFLPIENARVAVIAYGYNGEGYDYTHFTVQYDANVVQTLSPLAVVGEMSVEQKEALKNSIAAVAGKESSAATSAIGQALAAGVDTLLTGGATDGNACVILLTDGDATSQIAYGEAEDLAKSVPFVAKEHGWPVFCIELDYEGKNGTSEGADNRRRLTDICVNSGAGETGRMVVSDPAEVSNALLTIYDYFMETETPLSEVITIGADGVASREFTVPELASESNILISGSTVKYVELVNPKGDVRKIDASVSKGDWIANVETDEYISVKVVRPEAGVWTVRAYGDPNASIYVRSGIIRELDLELVGSPAPGMVTKNDTIKFQAYFTYHGGSMNNSGFYAENAGEDIANATVTSYDGNGNVVGTKAYALTGSTSGYHVEIPVSDIPTGLFTVQVHLKHVMFRTGEKSSNVLTYTSENLPLGYDGSQNIDRSGYVNADLEKIDLTKVFPNPDGDPIDYVIECVSDRNVNFEMNIDDNDYLTINTGLNVGTYQMKVTAADPDMTEPHVHSFAITVENRPMEVSKIRDQEVWVDYYDGFPAKQDPSNTVLDINLGDYYTDPDGVELRYGDIVTDVPGLINASWRDSENGKVLHIEPVAKGDVVLTTTVSDGIETLEAKIEIEVVSGKSIYWATHWFYYAIALGILVALVLFWLYVKANTTMKGSWKITIKKGYDSITTGTGLKMKSLSTVKKAKSKPFLLKDLINETMAWMQDQGGLRTTAAAFLGVKEFESVKLQGIYSGLGFMVLNVPGGDIVEIEYNSQIKPKTKKFRVTTGDLRITIKRKNQFGVDESLTILLENTGK